MKLLLLYPEYPDTFFSFKHAVKFIGKKSAIPPLGLVTVAAMMPKDWELRLLDLNVEPLEKNWIDWADWIAISSMYVQKESVRDILKLCDGFAGSILAGGPLFTHEYHQYPEIDHFILDEGENSFSRFLADLELGRLKKIYRSKEHPEMVHSPVPRYELLAMKEYASMNIQISRGCPYDCDFCEIPGYLGHRVRLKSAEQVLEELDHLFQLGWRGEISIVDDNFTGNRQFIKQTLLPELIHWMKKHRYPFSFNVQASLEIAQDHELIDLMVEAGIHTTFIGIESPSQTALIEGNKKQNLNKDLVSLIHGIQQRGMIVSGGFIVGFDSDKPDDFPGYIDFIQESGIVWAMVGLLNAPKNTRLYKRLEAAGRISDEATGSNTDYSMNFIPKMDPKLLVKGYRKIIEGIYLSGPYYARIRNLFRQYKLSNKRNIHLKKYYIFTVLKIIWHLGFLEKGRKYFWSFLIWTIWLHPRMLYDALMFSLSGYHFRRIYQLNKPL